MYGRIKYKRFDSATEPIVTEAKVINPEQVNDSKKFSKINASMGAIKDGRFLDVIKGQSAAATRGAVVGFIGFAGYAVLKKKNWIIYSMAGIVIGALSGWAIGKKIADNKEKKEQEIKEKL